MKEEQLEDGNWLYTFDESEDPEIYESLIIMAEGKNIKLGSPEFDEMFSDILKAMMEEKEFLEKIKKENSESE